MYLSINIFFYFRQLCRGVDYLHAKKIVHLDLKVDNLDHLDLKVDNLVHLYLKVDNRDHLYLMIDNLGHQDLKVR